MTTNQDKRGFASMPEEKVKDIASNGGRASAGKQDIKVCLSAAPKVVALEALL